MPETLVWLMLHQIVEVARNGLNLHSWKRPQGHPDASDQD